MFQLSASRPTVSRTPLFHVVQYGDDIIGRELNLNENCSVGSASRTHNLPNLAATEDNED